MADIFALDLGTTKFCLATYQGGKKLDLCVLPSGGVKKGMLSDFNAAKWVLLELIDAAEKKFNTRIKSVAVGITGNHLRYYRSFAQARITTPRITAATVSALQTNVKDSTKREKREILHIIPLCYRIDNREWVRNPIGFSGDNLEAEFFTIDSDRYYLEDVLNLCNDAGLGVKKFVAESIASASVTLSENEKEMGVALVDIGGGTADGIVFINGVPHHSFSIAIAGSLATQDLSYGLNISRQDAELVKQHFGLMTSDLKKNLDIFDLTPQKIQVSWCNAYPILAPRIDEFARLLQRELLPFHRLLRGGIALTGGGAQLLNLATYLKSYLQMNTWKIVPKINLNTAESFNLKYATALGLLNVSIDLSRGKNNDHPPGYLRSFFSWIRELSN